MLVLSTILLGASILSSSPSLAEPPINQYLPTNQLYGPPNAQQKPLPFDGDSRPGLQFGQGSNFGSNQYLPPNQQYGPPGSGISSGFGGYNNDANTAPAKYNFEYMVNDPPSANDFGHKESRDGDLTQGMYYVLLPDGRRQMVEYEADQNGYRPKITYSQVGSSISGPGGYPGTGELGGSSGSGGYPNGPLGGYPAGPTGYPSEGSGGYPSSSSGGYPSGGPGSYPSGGQIGYRY